MTGLLFLIPAALFLGGLGLAAFLWALRSGQFEDLDGAAFGIEIGDGDDDIIEIDADKLEQAIARDTDELSQFLSGVGDDKGFLDAVRGAVDEGLDAVTREANRDPSLGLLIDFRA